MNMLVFFFVSVISRASTCRHIVEPSSCTRQDLSVSLRPGASDTGADAAVQLHYLLMFTALTQSIMAFGDVTPLLHRCLCHADTHSESVETSPPHPVLAPTCRQLFLYFAYYVVRLSISNFPCQSLISVLSVDSHSGSDLCIITCW